MQEVICEKVLALANQWTSPPPRKERGVLEADTKEL